MKYNAMKVLATRIYGESREIRPISRFNDLANAPILEMVAYIGPGRRLVKGTQVDLRDYTEQLRALEGDEVFVIGKHADCDVRPGLANLVSQFREENPDLSEGTVQYKAENFYLRECRTISRFHAYIRLIDGVFWVLDCSLNGTMVLPREEAAPAGAAHA